MKWERDPTPLQIYCYKCPGGQRWAFFRIRDRWFAGRLAGRWSRPATKIAGWHHLPLDINHTSICRPCLLRASDYFNGLSTCIPFPVRYRTAKCIIFLQLTNHSCVSCWHPLVLVQRLRWEKERGSINNCQVRTMGFIKHVADLHLPRLIEEHCCLPLSRGIYSNVHLSEKIYRRRGMYLRSLRESTSHYRPFH